MYTKPQKEKLLSEYYASGLDYTAARRLIPQLPSRSTFHLWLKQEQRGELTVEKPSAASGKGYHRPHSRYTQDVIDEALRLYDAGMHPASIARAINVSSGQVVYSWVRGRADGILPIKGAGARPTTGEDASMSKKKTKKRAGQRTDALVPRELIVSDKEGEQTDWQEWAADLPEDPKERAEVMRRKYIEMSAVLDVLKVLSPGSLGNTVKCQVGRLTRENGIRLTGICEDLSIAKSSYLANKGKTRRIDRYAVLRIRITEEFRKSNATYGSERIWQALRQPNASGKTPVKGMHLKAEDADAPIIVSEKVVRKIMADEGLVPIMCKGGSKRYDSYAGEIDDRPPNYPLQGDGTHVFRADEPSTLVVTDVTEFKLVDFKCYLSPAIDCFDGCPIAWTISRHPDNDLCCGMLERVNELTGGGFTAHSDGGGCYRSARWKAMCEDAQITRSMSRKGRSPDNARAEGFFGTLKQEFFHNRDWTGVTYEEFAERLDAYIVWYRDVRLKESLGWKSIRQYREERGLAVY